jgi:hypothetical protein
MKTTNVHFDISFIGVGPQKTGSTWLYEVLKAHPSICLPTLVKEIQFFDLFYHKGLKEYQSYFEHCLTNQTMGEITPGYFDEQEVPERIKRHFPKAKIIISLRHPIKRVESLFRHHLRKGRVSKNFNEAIVQLPRIVDSGRYRMHMLRWYQYFDPKQIKVIFMEDIATQPDKVLTDILDFIGVDTNFRPTNLEKKINKTGMPKYPVLAKYAAQLVVKLKDYKLHHLVKAGKSMGFNNIYEGGTNLPSLTEEDKNKLLTFYEEDIAYVETLCERKLSAWRKI